MSNFKEVTLPLAKEQLVIVVTGVYDYSISTDVYDPLNPQLFGVVGADSTGNAISSLFTSGVDYTFANSTLTFLTDDIFEHQYFVFKITDDDVSRRTSLDGGTLEIFREEVKEETDFLIKTLNLFKEDILKKRVMLVETSFHQPVILPSLNTGQAWYYNGTEMAVFSVASVEENLAILDDYVENVLFPRLDQYVIDSSYVQIDNYVINTSYVQITDYLISTTFPSIDNYVDTVSIVDIQDFTNIKMNELQLLVDQAILDNGTLANGSDLHTAYYGYSWIEDITTMLNSPPSELLEGGKEGQFSVKESDGSNSGSGSDPLAPRTKATYIFRGTNGVTLYQIQTGETTFTGWMTLGASLDVVPFVDTDTVKFPTGLIRAVYHTGTTWELAYDTDTAIGIAVRTSANNVNIFMKGTIQLDALDVDSLGNGFVENEFYFLTQVVGTEGLLQREKPTTGVFQPLGKVYAKDNSGTLYFSIDCGSAEDITPLVIVTGNPEAIATEGYVDERVSARKEQKYLVVDMTGGVVNIIDQVGVLAVTRTSTGNFTVQFDEDIPTNCSIHYQQIPTLGSARVNSFVELVDMPSADTLEMRTARWTSASSATEWDVWRVYIELIY